MKRRSTWETVTLGLAVMVPLGFVLYTNEIWEDFLITYRHSENLIRGEGLVFTAGERVHGFTSPLNVLLPALFGWIVQARDFAVPLLGFRLVSLAGLTIALLAAAEVIAEDAPATGLRRALGAWFPLLAVLEIKTTAFAMNGQEAGLMLGFLIPLFVLACRGWPREGASAGGLLIAGLMYTRPDAFVHASAVALAGLAFHQGSRREYAASLLRSAGLGFLIYLPWMGFTQLYYGSFIPQTIVAKSGMETFQDFGLGVLKPVGAALAKLPDRLGDALGAIYDYKKNTPGGWPAWIHDLTFGLELVAVTYWFIPSRDRLGRIASFCSLLLLGYLAAASVLAYSCPWYYPPLAFLSLLALFRMAIHLPAGLGQRWSPIVSLTIVVTMFATLGFIFVFSTRALRVKQDITDWGHRRLIGLWLRENVAPTEVIFLEPLGYIGYFSQRRIHDWPGLVSPEVVAARHKIGHPPNYPWAPYYWGPVAEEIKPEWIVARPTEVDQMNASVSLARDYQLVKVFNATGPILGAGEFYGCAINYNDAIFEIFRRRAAR